MRPGTEAISAAPAAAAPGPAATVQPTGAAAGKQPQISGATIGAAKRSLASMARGEPGKTRLGGLESHHRHQPPQRQPRCPAVDGLQRLQGKPEL